MLLMIALGCGFFTGFRVTAPAMLRAAEDYIAESELMDLRLRSNIGVKSDEIAAVRKAEGVKGAFAGYTKELCYKKDTSIVVKAFSIPENISPDSVNFLNRPHVVEGRLPSAKDECAVELKLTSPKEFAVGGEISLVTSDPENDPIEATLSRDTFRIVGIVISPMFLGYERDTASIGDGAVNSNIYIPESDFTCDYYTDMYVTLDFSDMEELDPFSEKYREAVAERGRPAEEAFEASERARYDKLIDDAKNKIENGESSIAKGEEMLSLDKSELESRLEEARALAEQTRKKYGSSESIFAKAAVARAEKQARTLEELLNDEDGTAHKALQDELDAGKREAAEGRELLAAAPELKIYRDDRFSFGDYDSYRTDTEKTARLAGAFPPFFALTAALVCITAMSRMVEEQRVTIGAYRSLGYGGGAVLSRFLIYGGSAALIGGAGGSAAGMAVLPKAVMNTCKVLYNIPLVRSAFSVGYLIAATAVSVLLVSGAAAYACRRELSAQTAELMRPRPPAAGKRMVLERIGFVWNRLGFISKVTARNLFRYKKRALMTIAGVSGCCALITAGFGIRSSVVSILDRQFGNIFLYSAAVAVDDGAHAESLSGCEGVESVMPVVWKRLSAGAGDKRYSTGVISPEGSLDEYIKLRDSESGEALVPKGGAVVTEKLAELCGLTVGGSVEVRTAEGEDVSFPVVGIAENYALNFVFVDKELFDSTFPGGFAPNMAVINLADGADSAEVGRRLISENGVKGISWLSDLKTNFEDRADLMDKVLMILILCAMLLAVTVIFDLSEININERRRELASLKVLGFYDSETAAYVFRETFLLTLIGLVPGAFLGKLLHGFLVSAVEVDALMFVKTLSPAAAAGGTILTALFAVLVSAALYFKLVKIDPASSLGSVE